MLVEEPSDSLKNLFIRHGEVVDGVESVVVTVGVAVLSVDDLEPVKDADHEPLGLGGAYAFLLDDQNEPERR